MLELTKRVQNVASSPTLVINAKARAMRDAGEPIIHLGVGEPTCPAPTATLEALTAHLKKGKIKYTPFPGTMELRKAVLHYTKAQYNRVYEIKNVLISAGAKQSLFNFLMAAVETGDEVIFPAPYWVSYPEMIKLAGGTPVIVRPTTGLCVTAEQVIAAVTPRTKAILLNSPCNPAGSIFDEDFIRKIVTFAEEKQIFLVMDDIYRELVFDGAKMPNPCAYVKEGKNLVIVNGVSKLYGLTGLRIGWAVSHNTDLIAAMGKIQAQSTSCNCELSEKGAAAALAGSQQCVDDLRKVLAENRDALMAELSKIAHIKVEKPQGTFYSFVDFSHYNKDSNALASYLLDKARVAVVPGIAFGMEGYLRISFCADKNAIIEGVRRIRWALDKTAPNEIKIGDHLVTRE